MKENSPNNLEEMNKKDTLDDKVESSEISSDEMSMAELLAQQESEIDSSTSPGSSILMARVISFVDDGALVDVGKKSEALIPRIEFGKEPPFAVGDTVPVLESQNRKGDGAFKVSWRKAREQMGWEHIEQAHHRKLSIQAKVKGETRGGLLLECENGIIGFMPASQVDIRLPGNLKKWKGQTITVYVMEYDIRKNNLVLSRKLWLSEENQKRKLETLVTLKPGDIKKGVVTGITSFGAFVDIGGIEGLLHIGELEWSHTNKVSDVVRIGQEIEVKVMKFDPESEKISLSRKILMPHPWDGVEERFTVGSTVEGKVISITDFGAFVEIAPHVEGLLHSSEISWDSFSKKPQELLKSGKVIKVQILNVNREREKISLSLKRTQESPWEKIAEKYPVGSVTKVTVSYLVPFGAFARLPEGVEGLIHISDFSWTKRIRHAEDVVKTGEELEVKILDVNVKEEKISFGLRQIKPNPYEIYVKGTRVSGKITQIIDSGALMEIEPDMEGFIPRSEISQTKIKHPSEVLSIGEQVEAKVTQVDAKERKINLSIKRLELDLQRDAERKYSDQMSRPKLGELLDS